MIFFTLSLVSHLSLLRVEAVSPVTVSFTENSLISCYTAPSYPGSSSVSSPGSQKLFTLYSSLVPGSLLLCVLSFHNYNSYNLSIRSSVIARLCLGLLQAVSLHVPRLITCIILPRVLSVSSQSAMTRAVRVGDWFTEA